jgi:hypothetical protein
MNFLSFAPEYIRQLELRAVDSIARIARLEYAADTAISMLLDHGYTGLAETIRTMAAINES